jgi:hypothetical protein
MRHRHTPVTLADHQCQAPLPPRLLFLPFLPLPAAGFAGLGKWSPRRMGGERGGGPAPAYLAGLGQALLLLLT